MAVALLTVENLLNKSVAFQFTRFNVRASLGGLFLINMETGNEIFAIIVCYCLEVLCGESSDANCETKFFSNLQFEAKYSFSGDTAAVRYLQQPFEALRGAICLQVTIGSFLRSYLLKKVVLNFHEYQFFEKLTYSRYSLEKSLIFQKQVPRSSKVLVVPMSVNTDCS